MDTKHNENYWRYGYYVFLVAAVLMSLLLISCASEDVELDEDAYSGSMLMGNLMQTTLNYNSSDLTIADLSENDSKKFAFTKQSDIVINYDFDDTLTFSGFKIDNYFLSMGYNYRATDEIILSVPLKEDGYNIEEIAGADYSVISPKGKYIGTMEISANGDVSLSLDYFTDSLISLSGSISDNLDGTLNFECTNDTLSFQGTAYANEDAIIIISLENDDGTIIALKNAAQISEDDISGTYPLMALQYNTSASIDLSIYKEGEITISQDGDVSIRIEGLIITEAELESYNDNLFYFQYKTQNIYMNIIPGRIINVVGIPISPGDVYFYAVGYY